MPRFKHASRVAFFWLLLPTRAFFFLLCVFASSICLSFFFFWSEQQHIIKADSHSYIINIAVRSSNENKQKKKLDRGNKEFKRRYETTLLMMTFSFELEPISFCSSRVFSFLFSFQCIVSCMPVKSIQIDLMSCKTLTQIFQFFFCISLTFSKRKFRFDFILYPHKCIFISLFI